MSLREAAFFDVDGTLVDANVVHYYAYMTTCSAGRFRKAILNARLLALAPYLWALDKIDRGLFNARFYRSYRGWSQKDLEASCQRLWEEYVRPRMYPEGIEEVRQHKEAGRSVFLVSGSLAEIVRPIADELGADGFFAAHLTSRQGVLTGRLREGPMTGQRKAAAVEDSIQERGFKREECYGYADSFDDRLMLERVGHPRAVNPDGALRKLARRKGWEILRWKPSNT